MSESEPIAFRPRPAGNPTSQMLPARAGRDAHQPRATFTRFELMDILTVYGRKVAAGEWRDYSIDIGREKAVFSVFRRAHEYPIYRIEKCPKLARRQGAYSIVSATGLILKRGHDLKHVLSILEKNVRLLD